MLIEVHRNELSVFQVRASVLKQVNHQLESRMRENRTSGSEGGGAKPIVSSYPYFIVNASACRGSPFEGAERDVRSNTLVDFRSFERSRRIPILSL